MVQHRVKNKKNLTEGGYFTLITIQVWRKSSIILTGLNDHYLNAFARSSMIVFYTTFLILFLRSCCFVAGAKETIPMFIHPHCISKTQVLRWEHGSVTSRTFRKLWPGQPTIQPTDQFTDQWAYGVIPKKSIPKSQTLTIIKSNYLF